MQNKTSKKAQRRAERNQAYNLKLKELLKKTIKKTRQKDNKKTISLLDKAVKKGIIHKNKAARLKSRLSKIPSQKLVRLERKKPTKKRKQKKTIKRTGERK